MNSETVYIRQLANGITVLVEPMEWAESVAYDLIVPGGIAHDPADAIGASLILAEIISRGAGARTSREFSDMFDLHGIRHGEVSSLLYLSCRGSLLPNKLSCALQLLADMVARPHFPVDEVEKIRALMLQDLLSLQDSPAQWAIEELGQRYFPGVYGRCSFGERQGLENSNYPLLKTHWANTYGARGAILSIAGSVVPEDVFALIQQYFGEWHGEAAEPPAFHDVHCPGRFHIAHEASQQQVALLFPNVRFLDPFYYEAKVVASILSGGMFGRLFVEVRDKRGLCYSVNARHSSCRQYGVVSAYAGTTPERADQTLEVLLDVFHSVRGSVSGEELQRAKINLRANMVMGEDSSSARAVSNASDYWLMKRVRTLDEIEAAIQAVSLESVDNYLQTYPFDKYTLLTLGSRPISQ